MNVYKYLAPNKGNVSNFYPLEVVGRGSEPQLQVGENLDNFPGKGLIVSLHFISMV